MPRKSRDVAASLRRKGFVAGSGDHAFFTYVTETGLRTAVLTKISHGGNHDISDGLMSQMARQCKLPRARFLDLIDCPMSRAAYENELRQQGIID